MGAGDWPQIAQELMALQNAGVDMDAFLPKVAGIATEVQDAVQRNADRIAREGTEPWADVLRTTLPDGPVREAILSSPAWPEMAQQMQQLHERGVDVRGVLARAHEEGLGVDQAVTRVIAKAQGEGAGATPLSTDAVRSFGPLTQGLTVPNDLDLSDRSKALKELGVSFQENRRYVGMVKESLTGHRDVAEYLVSSRQWPLLAARMQHVEQQGTNPADHLARLERETGWTKGPAGELNQRALRGAVDALRKPPSKGPEASPLAGVAAAARKESTTTGPKKRVRGPRSSSPASTPPAAPAPAPAPKHGRGR